MPVMRYEAASAAALNAALKGFCLIHEEFGDMGTGKTTRANELAEILSNKGHHVIVIDNLMRGDQGGVRVFMKEG
jgi:tRNA uridine 5-carbamoylmethylation protein Kti12